MNLIELESLTAEGLTNSLLKCFADVGFTEYYLQRNWQVFASDGDSVMLGTKFGMATRLCENYPNPFVWHCLNNELELSVRDAADEVTNVIHLRGFLDCLHSVFIQSPKKSRNFRSMQRIR